MSPLAVATSTQLVCPALRLLLRHEALLKLGIAIMFVIVSIFSIYLGGNN